MLIFVVKIFVLFSQFFEMSTNEINNNDENNEIDLTICLVCNQTYTNPKFLPCGETACSRCLVQRFLASENECFFCKEPHDIQHLQTNKVVARLCEQKRNSFKSLGKNLVENLEPIYKEAVDLDSSSNQPESHLTEQFSKIVASIETHRDLIVAKVNKDALALIQELKEYELKATLEVKENLKSNAGSVWDLLDELESFYKTWM
jgi:hypothetical protein